jgi:chromosome segregation ATPase
MVARLLHTGAPVRSRWLVAGLLLSLAASTTLAVSDERFYRYDNAEGVTVIDDHVPPQFAQKGYEVLNHAGRVIEVVPRALTEAERRSDSAAVQARLRAEEAERQKRYDEALLARYSSVADIQDVQKRKVNEVQVRINVQKGAIASLQDQLEKQQAQAAEMEMVDQPVPAAVKGRMDELRAAIGDEEARIARLEQEKKTTAARYQFDIERFRVIRPGS